MPRLRARSLWMLIVVPTGLMILDLVQVSRAARSPAYPDHAYLKALLHHHLITSVACVVAIILSVLMARITRSDFRQYRLGIAAGFLVITGPVTLLAPSHSFGQGGYYRIGSDALFMPYLAALACLIYGASVLAARQASIGQANEFRVVVMPPLVAVLFTSLSLMYLPALGPVTLLLLSAGAVGLAAGISARYLLIPLIWFGSGVLLLSVVEPYRLARLTAFAQTTQHASTSNYQPLQDLYSISSGGWTGAGLGHATNAGFMADPFGADRIALLAREIGFVGTALVIVSFACLVLTSFQMDRPFKERVWGSVFGAWIAAGVVLHVASNVGLSPVVDVPLPFMSGSLTRSVADGVLLGLAIGEYWVQRLKKSVPS